MTAFPVAPGIYRITCTVTGKFYIGSAVNLWKRRKDHRHRLNQGIHRNPKLQAAWNKYGKDAFVFDILELVLLPELLTAREQYWFDALQPFGKRGFNLARIAGSTLGLKISPAGCANMSASRRGKPSNRLGYKATPETIERLKVSHLGQKPSFIPSMKGKHHRPESIEKCRATKLGHTVSQETRDKISASKTGHKPAPGLYANRMKTLIVTSPEGAEFVITGVRQFCREHHLDISCLMRVARGRATHHHGWTARLP